MSRRGLVLASEFMLEIRDHQNKLAKPTKAHPEGRQLPALLTELLQDGPQAVEYPEYDLREKLRMEREFLGFYISDHPLSHIQGKSATPLRQIQEDPTYRPQRLDIFCVVLEAETQKSKRGNLWTRFLVEDSSGGGIEGRAFGAAGGLPSVGHVARMRGRLDSEEGDTPQLVLTKADDYTLKEKW